jgi:AcrR family transcriptional regulator
MAPTGVAFRDARTQLFEAAERVLLRAGPAALTSRAVTTEAGCAKGVLHRHFADFDTFLAEWVLDQVAGMEARSAVLRADAGAGSIADNVARALADLFGSAAVGMVGLVVVRDDLRARLREVGVTGVPLLSRATAAISGYLARERDLGRLAPDTDVDTLAPMLIGTAHLLATDSGGAAPDVADLRRFVEAALAGSLRDPRR